VLERTLGVPLFQEQLMQMAMAVGGCTAEDADLLRRAMGSKRGVEKIERLRSRLFEGMEATEAILEYMPKEAQRVVAAQPITAGVSKFLEGHVKRAVTIPGEDLSVVDAPKRGTVRFRIVTEPREEAVLEMVNHLLADDARHVRQWLRALRPGMAAQIRGRFRRAGGGGHRQADRGHAVQSLKRALGHITHRGHGRAHPFRHFQNKAHGSALDTQCAHHASLDDVAAARGFDLRQGLQHLCAGDAHGRMLRH